MVVFEDKGKSVAKNLEKESAVVVSEIQIPFVEIAPPSLVLQTLDELERENEVIRVRLDKEDETNKEIKGMLGKQEESSK